MDKRTAVLVIYAIIATVAAVSGWMRETNLEIKHDAIAVQPIQYKPVFTQLTLPPHIVKADYVFIDTAQTRVQQYTDSVRVETDSASLSMVVRALVNIDKQLAKFEYSEVKIKALEIIKTEVVEIPKIVEKLVIADEPWYRQSWFWIWALEKAAILGTLAVVIFL